MSSYVQRTLISGEQILLSRRITLRQYWLRFIIAAFLLLMTGIFFALGLAMSAPGDAAARTVTHVQSLVFLGIVALLVVGPFIRFFTNELTLTSKRIVAKTGLVTLRTVEMNIDRIEGLRVEQGLMGRMLNYGTVVIIGVGGTQEPIAGIPNPTNFRVNFSAQVENLKKGAISPLSATSAA